MTAAGQIRYLRTAAGVDAGGAALVRPLGAGRAAGRATAADRSADPAADPIRAADRAATDQATDRTADHAADRATTDHARSASYGLHRSVWPSHGSVDRRKLRRKSTTATAPIRTANRTAKSSGLTPDGTVDVNATRRASRGSRSQKAGNRGSVADERLVGDAEKRRATYRDQGVRRSASDTRIYVGGL